MNIDKLKAIGVDYDEGIERFSNNTELYEKYLNRFLEDTTFFDLGKAIEQNDLQSAFSAAHTLKGTSGNLSFKPLYNAICKIIEPLRRCEEGNYAQSYIEISEEYYKIVQTLKGE